MREARGLTTDATASDSDVILPGSWRWNVWVGWFVQFSASLATSGTSPFVPIFLSHDLGVREPSALAIWTGVTTAALGVPLIISSPLWGSVADRYGRKIMLLRALFGSGFFMSLISLAREPWHLVALRFMFGCVTGMIPAMTALVASTTPRAQISWALGVLGSAIAIGSAVGPLLGGVLAPALSVRVVFLISGLAIISAGLLGAFFLVEGARERGAARAGFLRELRDLESREKTALGALVTAQCFSAMCTLSLLPMSALRFLEFDPSHAAAATGFAFALYGATSAFGAVFHVHPVARFGYRPTAFGAAALLAVGVLAAGASPTSTLAVTSMAVIGFGAGALQPLLSSLLGLEAPPRLISTVYGVSNGAISVGLATGPLILGFVAAAFGIAAAIFGCAVPVAAVVVCLTFLREPEDRRATSVELVAVGEAPTMQGR